jgi:hypothetical protein
VPVGAMDGLPWAEMGVISAIVVIVLVGIWSAKDVVLALLKRDKPVDPGPRITETMLGRLSASQVKAKADETQDERMDRLEERISECFRIEGQHRAELLGALKDLRDDLKDLSKRHDSKNRDQDRLINGCIQTCSTLEGMVRGKAGGSGITKFIPDKDKP